MTETFQPGDVVTCTRDVPYMCRSIITKGHSYTVTKVTDGWRSIMLDCANPELDFPTHCFTLLHRPAPKREPKRKTVWLFHVFASEGNVQHTPVHYFKTAAEADQKRYAVLMGRTVSTIQEVTFAEEV